MFPDWMLGNAIYEVNKKEIYFMIFIKKTTHNSKQNYDELTPYFI